MNTKYLDELVICILGLRTKEDVTEFLKGILTPQELEQLVTRLQIVKLLKAGVPQRQIAEELRVGIATVTRGSREIGRGRFGNIKE